MRRADRVLWIDLGGVVVRDPRPLVVRALVRRARRAPGRLGTTYYALSRRIDTGSISLRTMFARLRRTFGLRMDYPEFRQLVCDRSLIAQGTVVRALRRLKQSGSIRIVLTSNVSRPVWDGVRRKFSLGSVAVATVLSFRIGTLKPSRAFFREALRATRCEPGRIVFLDDSPVNVAVARRLGIRSHRSRTPRQTVEILRELTRKRRVQRAGPSDSRDHEGSVTPRRLPAGAARSRP